MDSTEFFSHLSLNTLEKVYYGIKDDMATINEIFDRGVSAKDDRDYYAEAFNSLIGNRDDVLRAYSRRYNIERNRRR